MNQANADVADLDLFLAALATKPLLDENFWQCYGYIRKPRRGKIWYLLFPKRFELEKYIKKEALTMGIIDVLNGIKKSSKAPENKLLIGMAVIGHILAATRAILDADSLMENLFSTYAVYQRTEKSKIHEPIILKAKDTLNMKNFGIFMRGTLKLLAIEPHEDFLLRSDDVKEIIEKTSNQSEFEFCVPNNIRERYAVLIQEKIFGSN